jgi:2-keto-3-deoxy-L-fuconate dehydrogenase
MAGRLAGKRVIVTDCNEYAGADIVNLFREEGGEVVAVDQDLTVPSAADDLIRDVGHVDILIANFAYPHKYAPAHKKGDEDMEYAMQRLFYPLHRLTRAILPQMLERKRGKIVVVGSADGLRGRSGGVALYGGARRPTWLHETCRDGGGALRQRQCDGAILRRESHLFSESVPRN